MAEPKTGALDAPKAAGNPSRGIRRRLAVFLRSDAARLLRAGRGAWIVMGLGTVGGLLMILAEFLLIRYVTTITASCSDLANPAVRDSCSTTGHESHYWGIAILGLLTILMAFGAAAGRSRPAAFALLVVGLVCLGITLLHDLPNTSSKGEVGSNFASAQAHIGLGFWFELVGALLAVGAAAYALTQLPEVAPAEAEVAADEEAAAAREDQGEPPAEDEARAEDEPRAKGKGPETAATGPERAAPGPETAATGPETAATKEAEPAAGEASDGDAAVAEATAAPTRAERIRAVRRGLGARLRRRRGPAPGTAADVGVDEGSEGEAVEPDSAEAVKAEEAGARAAKAETVEADRLEPEAEPAKDEPEEPERAREETREGKPAKDETVAEPPKGEAEPAQAEPEGDTWDVIPDTPAARRSAERRRKRQERAEAARKRQKRPPRERDRKNRPKDE